MRLIVVLTTFENVTKFSYPSAFLDELDNFKQKELWHFQKYILPTIIPSFECTTYSCMAEVQTLRPLVEAPAMLPRGETQIKKAILDFRPDLFQHKS